MNILHISTARTWRGGEEQIKLIVKAQAQDNSVWLLCPRDGIFFKDNFDSCKVISYNTSLGGIPSGCKKIKNILRTHRIDVIHVHDSKSHTLIYLYAKLLKLTIPVFVTRHTAFGIRSGSRKKYNHPSIRKIICVSEAVRQSLLPNIDDPNRLIVIPSSIESDLHQTMRFSDMYPNNGKKTVAYIAALTDEKRHDIYIDIAEAYAAQHPNQAHFYIIGSGKNQHRLEQEIKTRNLQQVISVTGYIKDIAQKIHGIDVILHTCENEALGTSILQAMAQGIPAVVHDNPGPRAFLLHEKNGFLVADYQISAYIEALYILLNNTDTYMQMSKAAKECAMAYDNTLMTQKLMKLYTHEIAL